jgi:hypothetical protein
MTGVSFIVGSMETTSTSTTGWWSCPGCDVDVELVVADVAGFAVDCPDCGETMQQWLGERAA